MLDGFYYDTKEEVDVAINRLNETARNGFRDPAREREQVVLESAELLMALEEYAFATNGKIDKHWGDARTKYSTAYMDELYSPSGKTRIKGLENPTVFDVYEREKDPGDDFFQFFRKMVYFKFMEISRNDKKYADRIVSMEAFENESTLLALADEPRMPSSGSADFESAIEMDEFMVELLAHVNRLKEGISIGTNEKKRQRYDSMFLTRELVHQMRETGLELSGRRDRQIFLALDQLLLGYTYKEHPNNMSEISINDLKTNKEIDSEFKRSNADKQLTTPFVLWVLSLYLHEVHGEKKLRESALHKAQQGYQTRMKGYWKERRG